MLGVSTSWRSNIIRDGRRLVEEILALEVDGMELEYRISEEMFRQMRPILREHRGKVFSIHNFFPTPPERTPSGNEGGDLFLLASVDEEERRLAVKYTTRTIQSANELEAQVVVLHLARAGMESIHKELFKYYDEKKIGSREYIESMREFKKIRRKAKEKTFDTLLLSMEILLREAERYNIHLGIENRYYFREYPDFDEIGYLLEKFNGGRLGYWHDTGHAKANENLGIIDSDIFLEAYGQHLLGIHLHDVKGYIDHYPPGEGEIDFDLVKKRLKPDTINIIEVHPRTERGDLIKGINFLREKGIT